MKTIGLLGGTGWTSTIGYYKIINELVGDRLGGYHSAKILLKSIDYHEIMISYGKDHDRIAQLLKQELQELASLKPDCILICCNSLHKYYDIVKNELSLDIPVFHAVELVAKQLLDMGCKRALLLATKFTMEDGFFAKILEEKKIQVMIPDQQERNKMQEIHSELMKNIVREESKEYFFSLTEKYSEAAAVILGCTEYVLVLDARNSLLPLIDPVFLQATHAVNYSLAS